MANRRFAQLDERFTLVSHDSRDASSEFAKQFSLRNNAAYFLLLDPDGMEIGRLGPLGKSIFDDQMVDQIVAIEQKHLQSNQQVFDFLMTRISPGKPDVTEIQSIAEQLGSSEFEKRDSASKKLLELGDPAYQFLIRYRSSDVESRSRIYAILKKLKQRHDAIDRLGLDHDIIYLTNRVKDHLQCEQYLKSILPHGVAYGDAIEWWRTRGSQYQWDEIKKRFQPLTIEKRPDQKK